MGYRSPAVTAASVICAISPRYAGGGVAFELFPDQRSQYDQSFGPVRNIRQYAAGGRAVKEEMNRLQALFPKGLSATLTYDASEYVSGELHKIFVRTLLCVAILLAFVYFVSRDCIYLFIIAVTLAVDILVAVVFYNLLDLNIHIYTLAGITVSLGIVIDTSIIMVDHYSYYHDRRVFVSILGALLTTIGALGVVWLLPESQRVNLTDFSLVIVINLVVSLLVALLFIPALLDKFPLRRGMTVSTVGRRRSVVRISRVYGRFIGWGRRHRWIFAVALLWGFGIPLFLLPERIEPEKGETLSTGEVFYNRIMESRFVTEHRSSLDKVFGSSLHLFNTATSRYSNYREPEQKVLYVNAGMAEGCTVPAAQRCRPADGELHQPVRRGGYVPHPNHFVRQCTDRNHIQARVRKQRIPLDAQTGTDGRGDQFRRSDVARMGHRRQFVQQQHRQPLPQQPDTSARLQLRPVIGLWRSG